jgi:hypothetical protein
LSRSAGSHFALGARLANSVLEILYRRQSAHSLSRLAILFCLAGPELTGFEGWSPIATRNRVVLQEVSTAEHRKSGSSDGAYQNKRPEGTE